MGNRGNLEETKGVKRSKQAIPIPFKPAPFQQELMDAVMNDPTRVMRLRSGQPSYEMIQLAKYLNGDLGKKYKADKIIFDEYTDAH